MTKAQRWFIAGSLLSGLAIVTGAFGAHGLEKIASAEQLDWWKTAAHYHVIHGLALLATAWACHAFGDRRADRVGWIFVLGIVLFSGSLYAMALGAPRWMGAITPFGGLALIAGWMFLAWSAKFE